MATHYLDPHASLTLKPLEERVEIAAFFPVIQELRPHIMTPDELVDQILGQHQEGYCLEGLYLDKTPVGAIGYRFLTTLAWGRILYLDDLIVASSHRCQGLGRYLLDRVVSFARANHCAALHLDTGYVRHNAHRLYLTYGFELSCHHLSYTL